MSSSSWRHAGPQQIAGRLRWQFPDEPEMLVSHETIYTSLFVQARGTLRQELTGFLRAGGAVRRQQVRATDGRGRIPGMVLISERPAEAEDRAVPGHWEGDLTSARTASPGSGRWSSARPGS